MEHRGPNKCRNLTTARAKPENNLQAGKGVRALFQTPFHDRRTMGRRGGQDQWQGQVATNGKARKNRRAAKRWIVGGVKRVEKLAANGEGGEGGTRGAVRAKKGGS